MNGLILTAMPEEAHLLGSGLRSMEDGPVQRFEGSVGGAAVRLVVSGIGKVAATLALQHAVDASRPDWMLVVGVAGAAEEGVARGTVVVPERAVQWDLDARPFVDAPGVTPGMDSDSLLPDLALLAAARKVAGSSLGGAVVTGDQVVASAGQRQELRRRFPDASCIDMETAAAAFTASVNGVPWAAIRMISDAADHTLDPAAVLAYTAEVAAPRLAAMTAAFVAELG